MIGLRGYVLKIITWTPKVCKIMALMAIIMGLGRFGGLGTYFGLGEYTLDPWGHCVRA